MSEILGIHQSDIIVRSAILTGLANLRADPSLLDFAFASLKEDGLTAAEYGESEMARAKEWYLHTAVSVRMETNPNEPKLPCISIKLLSSAEQDGEDTLADVHYVPQEDNDKDWPTLAGPVVATSWVPATGVLTLDSAGLGGLVLAPGMIVLAPTGNQYPILDVSVNGLSNAVLIQKNAVDQFSGAGVLIKPARPAYITTVESAVFRETYQLTCWVDSEEVHLTYLHSVLTFILLAYRETLLEARGYERCSVSSTAFERMAQFETEQVFARAMSITGTVRQYWPKITARKVTDTALELTATRTDDPESLDVVVIDDEQGVLSTTATGSAGTATVGDFIYYGASTTPGSLTAAFLQGLSREASMRPTILPFNAGATQYCWIALPASFGTATSSNFIDAQTLDEAGFSQYGSVSVGTVNYSVWRSNQPNLGALFVQVTL